VEEALELFIVFVCPCPCYKLLPRPAAHQAQLSILRVPASQSACANVAILSAAVILFDGDSAKRAPFFHLLRRLGLVRVVKSLLGDGADASKFGLSQVRSFHPSAFSADAYRIVVECELTSAAISGVSSAQRRG